MNEIFNPAPVAPVALHSDAFNLPRFSNAGGFWDGYENTGGLTGGHGNNSSSGLGTNTSGSGIWNNVGGWLDSIANIVTGVWGTSDKYMANAYQTMYNQERKTANLLIGIVVAFVLLAFAFLIIKKK